MYILTKLHFFKIRTQTVLMILRPSAHVKKKSGGACKYAKQELIYEISHYKNTHNRPKDTHNVPKAVGS